LQRQSGMLTELQADLTAEPGVTLGHHHT
jgi:hypothetical protein